MSVQPKPRDDTPTLEAAGRPAHPAGTASTVVAVSVGSQLLSREGDSASPVVSVGGDEIDFATLRGDARYVTGPLLGSGGMGEVRLHTDRRIGRRIAKKTLHATVDADTAKKRFLREVRIQGQLEHPAIVPVYDLDVADDGHVWFTMKRVRGETLEDVLEHLRAGDEAYAKRFGTRRLLGIFAQVCHAVDYAHARRVMHRDLKPSNVMIGEYGEVYVLDWGLAKVDGDADFAPAEAPLDEAEALDLVEGAVVDSSGTLTLGGTMLGTLAYMAPEQFGGKKGEIDARADLYALGAVLFEILTLRRLREETEPRAILKSITSGAPVRPSERAGHVPLELDELCARALRVRPSERPESAGAIAAAVERYLDGEQDLALRQKLASRHAAAARGHLEAELDGGAASRIEAMRETMKALALDPDNAEAQRLLVELITNVSDHVPPEARTAYEDRSMVERRTAARTGVQALASCLFVLPGVVLMGVRSWLAVGATAAVTLLAMAVLYRMARGGRFGVGMITIVAALVAAMIGLTSCYLGPFVIMPTCAATSGLMFVYAATRRERPIVGALLSAGALFPFAAEIFGWLPPAYAFEPGRIIILERAIGLGRVSSLAVMLYSTIAFTGLALFLAGRLRDATTAADRQQFMQAWFLDQIFTRSPKPE